jgi:hypothetical protein
VEAAEAVRRMEVVSREDQNKCHSRDPEETLQRRARNPEAEGEKTLGDRKERSRNQDQRPRRPEEEGRKQGYEHLGNSELRKPGMTAGFLGSTRALVHCWERGVPASCKPGVRESHAHSSPDAHSFTRSLPAPSSRQLAL